jgi:gamma-glutamyltranspeptidase/glutathione hydrolase
VAWERHGNIEWEALFQDAIRAAREGIAFPRSSAYYLSETWERIWSEYPDASELFGRDQRPMREGELLVQGDLAEALEEIAQKGPDTFYRGDLGEEIVTAIAKDGGFLSLEDMDGYSVEIREPIERDAFGWRIESNPPPAVGGAVMSHMLALLDAVDLTDVDGRANHFVEAQSAAMGYRKEAYQEPGDIAGALEEIMTRLGHQPRRRGETTHSSSAGSDGYVCSISESNGYGSGLVVHGMLVNNTLGEEELNPMGVHRLLPGSRCHSNMTPTIAGGPDRIVALGSPGADRIVGAIVQTLIRLAVDGDSLTDAVSAPRVHLDARPEGSLLCFEPGLDPNPRDCIPRPYDDIHMYFGAVQAASVTPDGKVDAAHDPRRSGASALV